MNMNRLLIKKGPELTNQEIVEINQTKAREFHIPKMSKHQIKGSLLFLLKDRDNNILAMGQLISVEPVQFRGETFSILGIGGIVSNIKGKGCGKKIMVAIKQYLIKKCKTGIGFCGIVNRGFYEKCGFFVDENSIQRFVHHEKGKKIVNVEDEAVLYFDSDDHFMRKVLAYSAEEVLLPRPPDW